MGEATKTEIECFEEASWKYVSVHKLHFTLWGRINQMMHQPAQKRKSSEEFIKEFRSDLAKHVNLMCDLENPDSRVLEKHTDFMRVLEKHKAFMLAGENAGKATCILS